MEASICSGSSHRRCLLVVPASTARFDPQLSPSCLTTADRQRQSAVYEYACNSTRKSTRLLSARQDRACAQSSVLVAWPLVQSGKPLADPRNFKSSRPSPLTMQILSFQLSLLWRQRNCVCKRQVMRATSSCQQGITIAALCNSV